MGTLVVAADTQNDARSLFYESLSLLHKTGGIASFDTISNFETSCEPIKNPLSAEQINNMLNDVTNKLRRVIELDWNIKEAHYFLGITYVRMMKWDEAISEFYNAMKIEPNRNMSYIILCNLLWDTKRYKEALDVSASFSKIFPESKAVSFFLIGNTYLQMGDFEAALNNGRKIIDLDASRVEGRVLMSSAYYCLGNLVAAGEQFKILESNPATTNDVAALKSDLKERCGEIRGSSP
jgi:tetratricopeptide (TPR) repeat protein